MEKTDHHIDSFINVSKEWLLSFSQQNYSKSSIASYERSLNRFREFVAESGIYRFQDVTFDHVNAWRLYLLGKYALSTTDLMIRSVRLFFNYLEENHYIFVNPVQRLVTPNFERRLLPVPTEKEINILLQQPDITEKSGIRDRAILEVTYATGMRLEELWGLTIFDPDMKQGVIRVTGKGSRERMIPLGKKSLLWLNRYMEKRSDLVKSPDEEALWVSTLSGKKLCKARVQQMFGQYAKKAGIKKPVSAHSLRRACATHMLNNGAHPVQIQMLLGHATLQTLSQYLRVTVTDMKKMHRNSRPGK